MSSRAEREQSKREIEKTVEGLPPEEALAVLRQARRDTVVERVENILQGTALNSAERRLQAGEDVRITDIMSPRNIVTTKMAEKAAMHALADATSDPIAEGYQEGSLRKTVGMLFEGTPTARIYNGSVPKLLDALKPPPPIQQDGDTVTLNDGPHPVPITKHDVEAAVRMRTHCVRMSEKSKQLYGRGLPDRIANARLTIWTQYALTKAIEPAAFADRLVESNYVEERDDTTCVLLAPPYTDRFHCFLDGIGGPGKWVLKVPEDLKLGPKSILCGLMVLWMDTESEDHVDVVIGWVYLDEPKDDGKSFVYMGLHTNLFRAMRKSNYADIEPTAASEVAWFHVGLEAFLQSKCGYAEPRRPADPGRVKRENRGRVSAIDAVIVRRLEKVEAKEEKRKREKLMREGKLWELEYESPTRGHWRNQYYKGTGTHKRIFIKDFVRGKGKPPRERIHVDKAQR